MVWHGPPQPPNVHWVAAGAELPADCNHAVGVSTDVPHPTNVPWVRVKGRKRLFQSADAEYEEKRMGITGAPEPKEKEMKSLSGVAAELTADCNQLSPRHLRLRMSGGKARGQQPRDTASEDALVAWVTDPLLAPPPAREGATDAQIADALRQGLPHLTDPASLQDSRAGKQREGTGTTEEGKQPAPAQKKRARTMRQAPQTQPVLLAADAFAAALGAVPAEDWCRTWPAGRTIMLRKTSKRVKEVVDKMRLPAVVRLSRSFWDDARNGAQMAKLHFVLRQLAAMTARCRITTLELPECDMKGQDAERLAGVLGQCRELVHLNLSGNHIGAGGAESLAGVLPQCPALAHLNLNDNRMGLAGAERLAAVLRQCRELVHLNLGSCGIGATGADRLAGVLGQFAALSHLDLSFNGIGPAGAERFAGVLAQCPALAHLNLGSNQIGPAGERRLRALWRGQASGLRL